MAKTPAYNLSPNTMSPTRRSTHSCAGAHLLAGLAIVCQVSAFSAHARDIQHITMSATALTEDESAANFCDHFTPTLAQVRAYFSKAYAVDHAWATQRYASPCYAKGRIVYADGNGGDWVLKSSGIGRITWDLGGEAVVFFGKNGWYDPFEHSYDDGERN